jgi:hypothetical protein
MNNRIEAVRTMVRMLNQTCPKQITEIRKSYIEESWKRTARSE